MLTEQMFFMQYSYDDYIDFFNYFTTKYFSEAELFKKTVNKFPDNCS